MHGSYSWTLTFHKARHVSLTTNTTTGYLTYLFSSSKVGRKVNKMFKMCFHF